MTKLYIKNMVCNRCVLAVQQVFERAAIQVNKISLGEVELFEPIDEAKLNSIDKQLQALGFERIDDRKARLIEAIKNKVIQLIHHQQRLDRKHNWSDILSEAMHYDYNYLSNLFSSVEGITLEQYIIRQKIEKAKELLFYDELNLSEIADRLGYSSVAHLSAQFKKITGLTPYALKQSRNREQIRKPIDQL
jgi:AraC family transcriptional regulator